MTSTRKTMPIVFTVLFLLAFIDPEEIFTSAQNKGLQLQSPYRQTPGQDSRHVRSKKRKKNSANKKHHKFYESRTASIKDHAIVNGEYTETSRVLVQKGSQRGVEYYPYGEHRQPVFIRKEREFNKRYIIFQDPYLPPGEGYLVVLKRIPPRTEGSSGMSMRSQSQTWQPSQVSYEAFHLLLSNNVHGSVDRLNVRRLAYRIRTKFSGRKNARNKFAQKRKKLSHARRRFALGKWRGKRSVSMTLTNAQSHDIIEPLKNLSHVLKTKPMKIISSHKRLGSCVMIPLNMTEIRLRLEMQRNLREQQNYDFTDDK